MRMAFDIGGVISKYPAVFREIVCSLLESCRGEVYVITDMHDKASVLKQLSDNGFGMIPPINVYCADYDRHGEFCKAILLRDLGIDVFVDDFFGYVQWDSQLGPAPVRLLMAPDGFKPYWADDWKCEGGEFGRRRAAKDLPDKGVAG